MYILLFLLACSMIWLQCLPKPPATFWLRWTILVQIRKKSVGNVALNNVLGVIQDFNKSCFNNKLNAQKLLFYPNKEIRKTKAEEQKQAESKISIQKNLFDDWERINHNLILLHDQMKVEDDDKAKEEIRNDV